MTAAAALPLFFSTAAHATKEDQERVAAKMKEMAAKSGKGNGFVSDTYLQQKDAAKKADFEAQMEKYNKKLAARKAYEEAKATKPPPIPAKAPAKRPAPVAPPVEEKKEPEPAEEKAAPAPEAGA